mmetsp:Transcript_5865/g.10571  ORF Transcript_5865/g.10571 Transcript_5865/m.10571 type:complete len:319 (-) Transcript_5865:63-1019(-)
MAYAQRRMQGHSAMGQLLAQRRRAEEAAVPSLKTICTNLLIAVREDLRDVGEMPAVLLRPILTACSASQLRTVENETRLGSGRSLKWDTWDLWRRHHLNEFGPPKLGVKVPQIRLPKPSDYDKLSRPADAGAPGDWRELFDAKKKELLFKQDETAHKMRRLYANAKHQGEKRTAVITEDQLPEAKRKTASWGSASSKTNTKDRLKAKLGISRPSGGSGFTTPAPVRRGQSTLSAGTAWRSKLAAARPVTGTGTPPSLKPKPSPPPHRRAMPQQVNTAVPPPRARTTPQPKAMPPPKPARLSVSQMISGMKADIKKQFS